MNRVKKIISYESGKYRGKNVCVCVLDTGIAPHPEFRGSVQGFHDAIRGYQFPYDDNGHGSHVCGILAGRHIGIAPESSLVVWKVLDERGDGKMQSVMTALRWLVEHHKEQGIRIVNISAGMPQKTKEEDAGRLLAGVELLWDMGIVVVAAAGNLGPDAGTITVPGISKKIITVGSSDDGFRQYSGRGPTKECVCKPDVVAPGSRIYSCNTRNSGGNTLYVAKSGTSMSVPIVSGAIACLLSKYPDMGNVEVKLRLRESCVDLGLPKNQQGWGLLNMKNLLA